MAYDEETLKPLHGLTEEGRLEYDRLLEEKADEILYRHSHPVRHFFKKILRMA